MYLVCPCKFCTRRLLNSGEGDEQNQNIRPFVSMNNRSQGMDASGTLGMSTPLVTWLGIYSAFTWRSKVMRGKPKAYWMLGKYSCKKTSIATSDNLAPQLFAVALKKINPIGVPPGWWIIGICREDLQRGGCHIDSLMSRHASSCRPGRSRRKRRRTRSRRRGGEEDEKTTDASGSFGWEPNYFMMIAQPEAWMSTSKERCVPRLGARNSKAGLRHSPCCKGGGLAVRNLTTDVGRC